MTEENTDYRAEAPVESETPGADASMTTEVMANLEEVRADPNADAATKQQAHERAAFETYVQSQGQKIPENFKDAGSWFDSLKGAQAKYTQTQQEIADLKKQYDMSGTVNNPDYVEPTAVKPPEETPKAPTEQLLDELKIPQPDTEAVAEPEVAPPSRVTEEDYNRWNIEVATSGTLSDESRTELKTKTGFTDAMLEDFMSAQKAKRQASFNEAATVVGSGEKLSRVLRWAANNFSGDQLTDLQRGLAGASSELTLRGIASAYDAANPAAEPARNTATVNSSTAQPQQLPGYKSMAEFSMDKSNPRYARDAKFRSAVDMRAAYTDWRTLS
tara:strand:+ start:4752 stop:5741 length:990 start_codon:yes stop_codon:yes gene_type:complete